MDILVASDFSEGYARYRSSDGNRSKAQRALKVLTGIVVSLLAALLSWQCNSRMGYTLGLKVLSSLLAFMFGGVYLVYYVLVRADTCRMRG